jgi:hypothetical protein
MTALLTALAVLLLAGNGDDKDKKPAYELVLKNTVLVRGADVRIADLCDVTPAGQDAFRIGQVVFAKAPASGYTRSINRSEILQALCAAGHPAGAFAIKGPAEVVVQGAFTEVSAQEMGDAATAALNAVLAAENATYVES